MLHLTRGYVGLGGGGCPTPHPGEVAGQLSQTDHLGLPDQVPLAVQQDRHILQRYPFEDRQQKSASRKYIDGKECSLELDLRRVPSESPIPCRNGGLSRALRCRSARGPSEFVVNRGQCFRDEHTSRPGEHPSREERVLRTVRES